MKGYFLVSKKTHTYVEYGYIGRLRPNYSVEEEGEDCEADCEGSCARVEGHRDGAEDDTSNDVGLTH